VEGNMSLFGAKEKAEILKLNEEISDLQGVIKNFQKKEEDLMKIIKEKDNEISKLSKSPHDKQFEKIISQFDKLRQDYLNLEKKYNSLEEENNTLKHSKHPKLMVKGERYKLLIKDLYSAGKFNDFKKICNDMEIIYVSQLEDFDFDLLIEKGLSNTKINNAKIEYQRYKDHDFNSDIAEYLIDGHRISKVFFRYRNFITYLTDLGIIYMYQLDKFDFKILSNSKFTPEQVEKFKEKLIEYNNLRKI
jgi:predicted RNase H-like nuclease (RuvC/YqgF family)